MHTSREANRLLFRKLHDYWCFTQHFAGIIAIFKAVFEHFDRNSGRNREVYGLVSGSKGASAKLTYDIIVVTKINQSFSRLIATDEMVKLLQTSDKFSSPSFSDANIEDDFFMKLLGEFRHLI